MASSEVLPSKERCPYLLVAEVLEQPFTCKSAELYAQRQALGVSAADVIQGKCRDLLALHLQSLDTNYVELDGNGVKDEDPTGVDVVFDTKRKTM